MSKSLWRQLQYECDFFKHLIRYITDETTAIKNRIAEVLKENFDRKMLDNIEYFQNECLKTDEIIGIVRNDITELYHYLSDNEQAAENKKKVQNIRNGLCQKAFTAQTRFQELQAEFNNFLFNNLE